jgi:hypothetical protein
MRPLALALLALVLLPVTAAGKDPDAPARVLWNSTPDGVQAGGAWDARLSLLQGPGGFDPGKARPVIVVTDLATHAERSVPMAIDRPPNTFKATVPFPRAGLYEVAVAGFDPRDPERFIDIDPPVRIEPAPATASGGDGTPWWPSALVVYTAAGALLAGAWSIQRVRVGRRNAANA